MFLQVIRHRRTSFALAIVSAGLAACSPAPTAPSAPSTGEAPPASVAASANADTIKITKGTLALQSRLPGTVTLQGTRGFRFDGSIISGLEPSNNCSAFDPCQPGATVPVQAAWVGTDIPGTVRLQGDEFPVGSLTTGSMYLELASSFVAPAHLTDTATVTVPFTASGLLTRDYPLPQLPLTGGGHVTFTFQWQAFIGGWGITYSAFDFGNGRAN